MPAPTHRLPQPPITVKARFARVVLAVSVILNLALLGELFRLNHQSLQPEVQPAPVAPAAAEITPTPFRWSQLESSDYPTYIANLRTIGCPELTVREIIAADVADLFGPRRGPLLARMSAGATPAEHNQAEAGLRQLAGEETAIMRKLFGTPNPVGPVEPSSEQVAVSPAPARVPRSQRQDMTAVMPLAFQDINPNALKLTAEDQQAIADVRQSFLADLGTDLDVNSPEYLHRWQKAQKQADSLLDGLLGRQFTLKYEEEVENELAANAPMPSGNQP